MNLNDQVNKAVSMLKGLFRDAEPLGQPPPDATIESLWRELQLLKKKKIRHPGVEECVKAILEAPELAEIPVAMVAEIVREVFAAYGIKCKCSESSVRWYQSQRGLEWKIIKRRLPKIVTDRPGENDEELG